MTNPKYTRILSIDGGGIRGILPAMILAKLESTLQQKTNNPNARLADFFDLVAGTSTGGILACGMLVPDKVALGRPKYAAPELAEFYLDRGDEIFDNKRLFGALFEERYSHRELLDALEDYFEDWELSDLLRPTLITAYNIKRRKAHFFRQHKAKKKPAKNFNVRDVAWATAAAPTYFEPARIKSKSKIVHPFVDGGVFANNPVMCAYVEARAHFKKRANEMVILSLGTGGEEGKDGYSYKEAKGYGVLKWAEVFADITLSGVSQTVNYQLKQIYNSIGAPGQFVRIDPDLGDASADLDDASAKNLKELKKSGKRAAKAHKEQLSDFADLLLKTKPCDEEVDS